jgi:ribosomal protein S18 acetylase RimI-like enzyme
LNTDRITYLRADATTPAPFRAGFVAAYQEAFGGAPYFEHYTEQEVLDDVWWPHLNHGLVILAIREGRVVGFGCAMPLDSAPDDIQEFLGCRTSGEFPAEASRTWYMSEIGVMEPYRRHGIGYGLVRERLSIIEQLGGTHYVLRTAAEGSNSAHMYRRIGAIQLMTPQDISESGQVQVSRSQSTKRIFLFGSCAEALRALSV